MKVRLDPRAVRDLEDIRSYLVERSPAGAERVRQHIAATIERLGDFPLDIEILTGTKSRRQLTWVGLYVG
jgi:plasmid stabilization system protein ParE